MKVAKSAENKQSLYLNLETLKELRAEAKRQDRSMSWLMDRAWKIAREQILKMPTAESIPFPMAESEEPNG